MDCHALAEAFYARVANDPILRPLFPGKSFRCATEELAAFLVQILGGPAGESQHRWWLSIRESHSRFRIGERERTAWMTHMNAVLAEEPEELRGFFEQGSHYIAHGTAPGSALWQPQLALDKAVEAIVAGDAEEAIRQTARCSPTVFPGILARMIASRNAELLAFAHKQIQTHLALVEQRYANRTLLHYAAGAGSLATVQILLACGADPNCLDGGRHTPLYAVANQCKSEDGPAIVRALADGGAAVDAAQGVQRCTPLHMAARRGHTAIAAALLDCGADINARDRKRETPLRRALNCRQPETAAMLRGRGGRL